MSDAHPTSSRVFLSYSRDDIEIADEIAEGLEWGGFEVILDRNSIAEGEDWKGRLSKLIEDADSFVFLISSTSLSSEICEWEVSCAQRLGKRLIPAVIESVDDESVPSALASLNYVRFDDDEAGRGRPFIKAVRALIRALNTDLEWVREHTRLLNRAIEWEQSGRNKSRLLLSDDVAFATSWIQRRSATSPPVTELQQDFIRASETAELARKNEEAKRLEEVSRLQAEHEKALSLRETEIIAKDEAASVAQKRASVAARIAFSLLFGAVVVGLFALYFSSEAVRWKGEYEDERLRKYRDAGREDITGELIVFASSAGEIAMDGTGDSSPFTAALLNRLRQHEDSILDIVNTARLDTLVNTEERQRPSVTTNMTGEVFLHDMPDTRTTLALTLGVNDYENAGNLVTSIPDARRFRRFFEQMGIKTLHIDNPTRALMTRAFRKMHLDLFVANGVLKRGLCEKAESNTLAIVYYSGHGLYVDGIDYITPSDFDASSEKSFRNSAMSLEEIRSVLQCFAARIFILDVDRTNPFRHYIR